MGNLTVHSLLMATPNSRSPDSLSSTKVQMWMSPPLETSLRFSTSR